jgi:hypothetical protein
MQPQSCYEYSILWNSHVYNKVKSKNLATIKRGPVREDSNEEETEKILNIKVLRKMPLFYC